jgi:PKD repeat protein
MKKILVLLMLPAILISFTGCRKTPVSCISADKKEITEGGEVAFTSCATDAARVVWDFGHGTTVEGESATHKFTKAGVYLVTATSYSKKDKRSDKASVLITVNAPPAPKSRYLTKVVLKGFPLKKPDGSNWDTSIGSSPEPDVFIQLKLNDQNWSLRTSTIGNAKEADLPSTWYYAPENIFMVDSQWIVEIRDDNGLTYFGSGGSDLITEWTSNLSTATATGGVITLTNTSNPSGSAIVEIHFEER